MKSTLLALAVPLLLYGASASAGDMDKTAKAAFEAKCAECHYEDDFAGESKEDIMAMIKDVVSGEVDHKGDIGEVSEEQMAQLAAFFASFK